MASKLLKEHKCSQQTAFYINIKYVFCPQKDKKKSIRYVSMAAYYWFVTTWALKGVCIRLKQEDISPTNGGIIEKIMTVNKWKGERPDQNYSKNQRKTQKWGMPDGILDCVKFIILRLIFEKVQYGPNAFLT